MCSDTSTNSIHASARRTSPRSSCNPHALKHWILVVRHAPQRLENSTCPPRLYATSFSMVCRNSDPEVGCGKATQSSRRASSAPNPATLATPWTNRNTALCKQMALWNIVSSGLHGPPSNLDDTKCFPIVGACDVFFDVCTNMSNIMVWRHSPCDARTNQSKTTSSVGTFFVPAHGKQNKKNEPKRDIIHCVQHCGLHCGGGELKTNVPGACGLMLYVRNDTDLASMVEILWCRCCMRGRIINFWANNSLVPIAIGRCWIYIIGVKSFRRNSTNIRTHFWIGMCPWDYVWFFRFRHHSHKLTWCFDLSIASNQLQKLEVVRRRMLRSIVG